MSFLEACALLSLATWLYLWLGRVEFWKTDNSLAAFQQKPLSEWPSVHVFVPARNEADMLPLTLPTLLNQRYSGDLHIFLIDDQSQDGTAEIAREIGRRANAQNRITVLETKSGPPVGWSGKLWALNQGLGRDGGNEADYLLFTDADIAHDPESVKKLITAARGNDLDLVSLMATLRTGSFWSRLLLPAFVYFFAMLYPFSLVNRPGCRTAAAAGGCALLRRDAFIRAGGLEPIAGALIDDCSLAHLIKQRGRKEGGRIWLGLGREVVSLRNSESLEEIWRMVKRTAFVQLRYSNLLLVATMLGMVLVFLAPVLVVLAPLFPAGDWTSNGNGVWPFVSGFTGWLLMTRTYLPMTRWYGRSFGYALTLPLAGLLYTLMTLDSALAFWLKRGGAWKGRIYGGAPEN